MRHYIPSSLWQTQLPPISSPKCHMLIYMLCWISSWYCQYYSWNTTSFHPNNIHVIYYSQWNVVFVKGSWRCNGNMWRLSELMGGSCVCPRGLLISQHATLVWAYRRKLCLSQGAGDQHVTLGWHPQLPLTNTTSAYMFTQVSHVSITSPAPCDKHNFANKLTQVVWRITVIIIFLISNFKLNTV
jgi:hypothetical protein